ncbi:MAG: DUF6084 family protein, partial [Actinomycetota bacterium]
MNPPRPSFAVVAAQPVAFAAAPTLAFTLAVTEPEECEVYTVALTCQINIDPARREYDAATRELLVELFGEPRRWAATTRSFRWLQTSILVPSFRGSATFELPVLCNYDLELAATKYFYSLPDGEIPLTFLFSGTVLYQSEEGGLRIVQVPWEGQARFKLPVETWRAMVTQYYPQSGWVRLHTETLALLGRFKAREGLPSFDACVTR